jgi:hypothetical protein
MFNTKSAPEPHRDFGLDTDNDNVRILAAPTPQHFSQVTFYNNLLCSWALRDTFSIINIVDKYENINVLYYEETFVMTLVKLQYTV